MNPYGNSGTSDLRQIPLSDEDYANYLKQNPNIRDSGDMMKELVNDLMVEPSPAQLGPKSLKESRSVRTKQS